MNATAFLVALAAGLVCGSSLGQKRAEGELPPRPDIASGAAIGGWCDALTGAKKEQCLRDERLRQQEKAGERKERRPRGGDRDAKPQTGVSGREAAASQ